MDKIADRIKYLMSEKGSKTAPIEALLMDDTFCTMMMKHRIFQGMRLPDQSLSVDVSHRLAYLHALASGTGVEEARELSDMTGHTLKKISELKKNVTAQVLFRHISGLR